MPGGGTSSSPRQTAVPRARGECQEGGYASFCGPALPNVGAGTRARSAQHGEARARVGQATGTTERGKHGTTPGTLLRQPGERREAWPSLRTTLPHATPTQVDLNTARPDTSSSAVTMRHWATPPVPQHAQHGGSPTTLQPRRATHPGLPANRQVAHSLHIPHSMLLHVPAGRPGRQPRETKEGQCVCVYGQGRAGAGAGRDGVCPRPLPRYAAAAAAMEACLLPITPWCENGTCAARAGWQRFLVVSEHGHR